MLMISFDLLYNVITTQHTVTQIYSMTGVQCFVVYNIVNLAVQCFKYSLLFYN